MNLAEITKTIQNTQNQLVAAQKAAIDDFNNLKASQWYKIKFRLSVCAQCEKDLYFSKNGWRGHRDEKVWLHHNTDQPWCKADKQHGPKSRLALPVPNILIIDEIGVPQT